MLKNWKLWVIWILNVTCGSWNVATSMWHYIIKRDDPKFTFKHHLVLGRALKIYCPCRTTRNMTWWLRKAFLLWQQVGTLWNQPVQKYQFTKPFWQFWIHSVLIPTLKDTFLVSKQILSEKLGEFSHPWNWHWHQDTEQRQHSGKLLYALS